MADSSETVISWTPANWITVSLMVFLMYALVGFLAKVYQQKKASS